MVRFKNTARPKEAKTIMTAPNSRERVPAPIFRRALEFRLRFTQDKFNRFSIPARLENDGALAALMRGGIGKEFEEAFLQEIRVNLEGLFA